MQAMRSSSTTCFAGLDALTASAYVRVALANVVLEFPNKLDHVMDGEADACTPRTLHPVFYGSFDWHSCVHMHWLLARVLRRHPTLPEAASIVTQLNAHLTPDRVAVECGYLDRASSRAFERPYGWAWLLALQTELHRGMRQLDRPAGGVADTPQHAALFTRWHDALAPLAERFAHRFARFLPLATYPMRVGTHPNTAFALLLALDHAERCGRGALAAACRERAIVWYAHDRDYPIAYEPSLDEFLSPGLMEAALMARVLEADAAGAWLQQFLPRRDSASLAPWLAPPVVSDRSDPKLAHLDGLALSRAWCMRRLIDAGVLDDATRTSFQVAATLLSSKALPHVADGDYMGEHWLASFAALAQDDL